ncbi:MAG: hypothetical protein GX677_07015 [Treponema sp.]|jgi:hypothetical protein|nr:hypothetical protein [Treponema sp.]
MKIYVNNELIEVQLEGEKNIGDVLKSFEITCEENNAAVIGIIIDGKKITADDFDSVSQQEFSESTKIEFSVVTEQNIKDSFANLASLFQDLSTAMENVPTLLQNNKNNEVANSITKLADNIDSFSHIAALSSLFPNTFSDIKIDDQELNNFFNDFSPILLDFENALKSNDSVLIGDLSEYEICPRLKSLSKALIQFTK